MTPHSFFPATLARGTKGVQRHRQVWQANVQTLEIPIHYSHKQLVLTQILFLTKNELVFTDPEIGEPRPHIRLGQANSSSITM